MKKILGWCSVVALLAGSVACQPSAQQAEENDGWVSMLDDSLSQWRVFQSFVHKNGYRGQAPVDSLGNEIEPIGYDKNVNQVFRVEDIDGEKTLHITGEIYGSLFTREDYGNYRLKLKVKFGEVKFEPRLDKPMDSGVIYHSSGECGKDYFRTWMRGNEFQVQDLSQESEECFGNYWGNAGAAAVACTDTVPGSYYLRFNPEGEQRTTSSCILTKPVGAPHGEWTDLEIICFEGKSLHLVNGEVVLAIQRSFYKEGETEVPMTQGKIQIQCEAAEVFYKDIKMLQITAMPEEYASYFAE